MKSNVSRSPSSDVLPRPLDRRRLSVKGVNDPEERRGKGYREGSGPGAESDRIQFPDCRRTKSLLGGLPAHPPATAGGRGPRVASCPGPRPQRAGGGRHPKPGSRGEAADRADGGIAHLGDTADDRIRRYRRCEDEQRIRDSHSQVHRFLLGHLGVYLKIPGKLPEGPRSGLLAFRRSPHPLPGQVVVVLLQAAQAHLPAMLAEVRPILNGESDEPPAFRSSCVPCSCIFFSRMPSLAGRQAQQHFPRLLPIRGQAESERPSPRAARRRFWICPSLRLRDGTAWACGTPKVRCSPS
jgi:hypothetical protein